ncbi:MAG: hypothetical protein H6Q72_968 [Firmicutes bacterium]|nr:hypothetical protein [Bacillota bacterium]
MAKDVIVVELSTADKRIARTVTANTTAAAESATAAATSAANAATSETNAATSATSAATSASSASTSLATMETTLSTAITTATNTATTAATAAAQSATEAAQSAALALGAEAEAWSATTTYNYPDVVAYTDGYAYRCIGTAVLGDIPPDSANWVRAAWVANDFFDIDEDGDLMPALSPTYSADFELDEDGDIMPKE